MYILYVVLGAVFWVRDTYIYRLVPANVPNCCVCPKMHAIATRMSRNQVFYIILTAMKSIIIVE